MIYLDYAATTPICREALDVYNQMATTYFGNASSLHDMGTKAEQALLLCREKLADIINGQGEGVYFTSGGSEANHLAIRSLIKGNEAKGKHLITTEVEHASLYELFKQLEKEGYDVTFLKVDQHGQIQLEELKQSIRNDTILASIQHANSETGVIQPMKDIGGILQEKNVIFHTDAVQTFTKIPIDVDAYQIDSLSIASHKIYGPKGVGACYIRPDVKWKSVQEGATHESGFRMGTVDVPGVVAFATAAEINERIAHNEYERMQRLRDVFIEKVTTLIKGIQIEEHTSQQMPGIIGLTSDRVQGQHIMLECNRHGIAISTGSACRVGETEPSRTMLAMGKTKDIANGFFRLSLGKQTTKEELNQAIQVLHDIFIEL